MNDILLFLTIIMTGIAGLLCIVSTVSWYRIRSTKFLLLTFAFFAMGAKAILLTFDYIIQDEKAIVIDCIVLVFLYFSTIKK